MEPVLVDSNVLFDLAAPSSAWFEWSANALRERFRQSRMFINPIIYAELSAGCASEADAERLYRPLGIARANLPWQAAFAAGRAFVDYRQRGGEKRSPLPDFYVGAHALVADMTLLTRDAARYRTYFPTLRLIAPEPAD